MNKDHSPKKMWEGRTDGVTDAAADGFNSSVSFDFRMYGQDIAGSVAHAKMLADKGIIKQSEADEITAGLAEIHRDIISGALKPDPECEDLHMFIEAELTRRTGDSGKRLHTARSRNDQVALDLRLYLRHEIDLISQNITALIDAVAEKADEYKSAIMPGYTHLQRAQPISFGHQLAAYAYMLLRDLDRLYDCRKRLNLSPIGCCALAGTTYDIDRRSEADALGFDGICENSIDGVSDRDFCLELASDLSIIMMHLSRFSEEIILWSSWEFRFVTLSDAYTTGSSIMPQKKNPDMAELVRGKTGRVYGDLFALFTVMKGLPLAYNKDMQEDKESIFDACDTVKSCLDIFCRMISTMSANTSAMRKAAGEGFINATDLADYLVGKGLPFREAYKAAGKTVALCAEKGLTLETLPIEDYRAICPAVDEGVYSAVDLDSCLQRRTSEGGPALVSVERQIAEIRNKIRR